MMNKIGGTTNLKYTNMIMNQLILVKFAQPTNTDEEEQVYLLLEKAEDVEVPRGLIMPLFTELIFIPQLTVKLSDLTIVDIIDFNVN